jgi:hypothetical protein
MKQRACKTCGKFFKRAGKGNHKHCDDCVEKKREAVYKEIKALKLLYREDLNLGNIAGAEEHLSSGRHQYFRINDLMNQLKTPYVSENALLEEKTAKTADHVYGRTNLCDEYFNSDEEDSYDIWKRSLIKNMTIDVSSSENTKLRTLGGGLRNYPLAGIEKLFNRSTKKWESIKEVRAKNPQLY